MSKFTIQTTGTNKTVNTAGGSAYVIGDKKLNLTLKVMSALMNEPKFYGDNTPEILDDIRSVAKTNPKYIANLAVYCREVLNLRSISHVLCAELAFACKGQKFVKQAIQRTIKRVDDSYEILGYYMSVYGKPIPNSMKKGIASALGLFDEYELAKYNRTGKKPSLKDVICLTHPEPRVEFKNVIEGKIEPPRTWEVVMSTTPKAQHKEAWESLIADKKLGYMACLRNLKNMLKNNISNLDDVLNYLTNEKAIAGSKQLPFRFFSAYREVEDFGNRENLPVANVMKALDEAISKSIINVPKLSGTTVIINDNSGSMSSPLSCKSSMSYIDVASLFSAISTNICENAVNVAFGHSAAFVNITPNGSIFDNMKAVKSANVGHSTHLYRAFNLIQMNKIKADRIIVFSDLQAYTYDCGNTANMVYQNYRNNISPNVVLHSVDLAGYGTSQFIGNDVNLIGGWSDRVFEYMNNFEMGADKLVDIISNYQSFDV